jgi:hypothetical protein
MASSEESQRGEVQRQGQAPMEDEQAIEVALFSTNTVSHSNQMAQLCKVIGSQAGDHFIAILSALFQMVTTQVVTRCS